MPLALITAKNDGTAAERGRPPARLSSRGAFARRARQAARATSLDDDNTGGDNPELQAHLLRPAVSEKRQGTVVLIQCLLYTKPDEVVFFRRQTLQVALSCRAATASRGSVAALSRCSHHPYIIHDQCAIFDTRE